MRQFELENYLGKWEFKAPYHLTASDIQSTTINELLALASDGDRDAFMNLYLGYTEIYGLPELQREIADTYDTVEPEDILCFAGAEEGIYVAMHTLLDKGDHAIVVVPNYQAAETIPLDICQVSGVVLEEDDNWQLDIDRVRAALRPTTKVISVNFPNNPTGAILERRRFEALVELCRERGIYLFSDEVYRGVEMDPSVRLPQAVDAYEKGLSLNVMSKAYGLAGLRLGWIACKDREQLQLLERTKLYLSLCNSAPSEQLALIALRARDTILERNRNLLRGNLEKLDSFFGEFPHLFDWKRPDGSAVAFPAYRGPGSTDTFCEELIDESGVLLLPPRIYWSELMDVQWERFRIGFGRKGMDEALDVFRNHLKRKGY
ncbi:MAG: aminotransferase class I/II-fold pyridoxal phosphate-dependent enzyme [Synergistales bacterium]|nr:aminotransferase class I/II-fold pyridoxal phosphate-dependent enzyme [Synergistales bacterium]